MNVAELHSLLIVIMIVPHNTYDVLRTTALTLIVYTRLANEPIAPLPEYTGM